MSIHLVLQGIKESLLTYMHGAYVTFLFVADNVFRSKNGER